ncbi:hypothetical protein BH23PLA1_BH23PLA1_02510 [soil metagenome]
MRLTLRTLLAWLDDTLPPAEVRQIGQQVSESPFAQQLVERIRQVTRRRRLSVPPSNGPDAVDANLVASYLDNELDAEKLAEYEKRCLTSDVHLAEVSSVHQILSMIKNKAKVPPEARRRMYRLIKGREAVPLSDRAEAIAPAAGQMADSAPPWKSTDLPTRPLWEQIGPPLAVVGLIVALGWLAWANLTGRGDRDLVVVEDRPQPEAVEPGPAPDRNQVPAPDVVEPFPEEADPKAEADPDEAEMSPPEPAEIPPGVIGVFDQTDGIALRFDLEDQTWKPLEPKDELEEGDRVLSLAPYRGTLRLGGVRVVLVGEAEVRLSAPEQEGAIRFDLLRGRVQVQGSPQVTLLEVGFEQELLTFELPEAAPIGLQRRASRTPGDATGPPLLFVSVAEGQGSITLGNTSETLQGPAILVVHPVEGLRRPQAEVPADWVSDPDPTPEEIQAGEAFAELFRPGDRLEFSLLQAIGDPRGEVQALAVQALAATENLEFVIPQLDASSSTPRRAAVEVLRDRYAEGPEGQEEVRKLLQEFPPAAAQALERLLIGFDPASIGQDEFAALVEGLASPNVGVRDLSIQTLQDLTGRDRLGYDPDNPQQSALEAWRKLLQDQQLRPVGNR